MPKQTFDFICVLCEEDHTHEWYDLNNNQVLNILQDLKQMDKLVKVQEKYTATFTICDYCVAKNRIFINDYYSDE